MPFFIRLIRKSEIVAYLYPNKLGRIFNFSWKKDEEELFVQIRQNSLSCYVQNDAELNSQCGLTLDGFADSLCWV